MNEPNSTTKVTEYDSIERVKTAMRDEKGNLVFSIETMHNKSVDYHQTLVRNENGYPLRWYDNRGAYEEFRWYSVPDKKGNPVWHSVVVHSTIHFIHGEVKYSMKGYTKLQQHRFMKKLGERYD